MTDMIDEFDFSGSMGAEVAKESNKGSDIQREIEFLKLDASEEGVRQGKHQALVRIVTEYEMKQHFVGQPVTPWSLPWITVKQHYAQTKQRPPYVKEGQTWPGKMYGGCRKDKIFAKRFNNQCPLCDQGSKASDRTWALGIEREEVIDNGQVVGIRDKMREVFDFGPDGKPIVLSEDGDKKTYKKKHVPAWVVLNFGWKNFFNALSGQAQYRQTVLDRDYIIQRSGMDNNNTNYTFIPLDPIMLDGDNPWGLAAGSKYDLGTIVGNDNGRPVTMMETLYPEMPDLRRIVAERVSDDYLGRWFIPGWLPEGFDASQAAQGGQQGVQSGYQGGYQPTGGFQAAQQQQAPQMPATPQPAAQQQAGPSMDALAALKARVTGQAPQEPAQTAQ